ncbi:MAG: serine/threonine-protein kinase, partial [Myxococcota bacterium]
MSYATQIVMALEDVHASGLVHRDLKPENLILTRSLLGDEQLKLIDFGIAHGPRADGAYPTHTGELIGTARYMAPELFTDGNQDDPRVDIYAIGVLMYEMVAARGPFDHLMEDEEDLEQVIRHHIVSEPAPLTSRDGVGELPQGLPALIRTCLARSAEERFANASELLQALGQLRLPTTTTRDLPQLKPHARVQAHVWPIPQEEGPPILATAITGVGGYVAATDAHGTVWIWDFQAGDLVRALTELEEEPLPECKARLGFAPNGTLLAVGGRDGRLWLYDIKAYTAWPLAMVAQQRPNALTFDHSSSLMVLSTSAGDLELWDMGERHRLARFSAGQNQRILSLTFSPDRRSLVAGTEDGQLLLWHFSDRSQSGTLPSSPSDTWPAQHVRCPSAVLYQDISRDGSLLAVLRAGGVVELWSPATKMCLGTIALPSEEQPRRLTFSPDSRQILVAYDSGTVVIVDTLSRGVLDTIRVPRGEAVNISYTTDAVPIASIARGASIQVWDLLRMERLQTFGSLSDHLLDVTVTPQGDRALVLSARGTIDTWDLMSGRHLGRQPSLGATVRRLDKAPEAGRVLLCGAHEGLMALDGLEVNNLTPLRRAELPIPPPAAERPVQTYAISHDT